MSFFISPYQQRLVRSNENIEGQWFNRGRHVIEVHFEHLLDVSYSHYDCAVSLTLHAKDWKMSSLRFLQSNQNSSEDLGSMCETENEQALHSMHSERRRSLCSESSSMMNGKKSIRIFVKRTEFRSFVDRLVSRGITISAEDDPDGGNSTVSFQCVPPVESIRKEDAIDKLCLKKTTQMELNTKYGLDDPLKIIAIINQATSKIKHTSADNKSISEGDCENHNKSQSTESKLIYSKRQKVTTMKSMDRCSDPNEMQELHSSQIVTPMKTSTNHHVVDSCNHIQSSASARNDGHKQNGKKSTHLIEKKQSHQKTKLAKISPLAQNRKNDDSQYDIVRKTKLFINENSENPSTNPENSRLQKISALWHLLCPLNEDCSLDQSKRLSKLMNEKNSEGDNLANKIIQIDKTISDASIMMNKLKYQVMQLQNFPEADSLFKSLSWIESATSMTISGSNSWTNQKKRIEEKIVENLLKSITEK